MSKPGTPVRRSKSGRPGVPGGGEIPLTASMEVLSPAPGVSSTFHSSMDMKAAGSSRPRTPVGAIPPILSRQPRSSQDGSRRSCVVAATVTKQHESVLTPVIVPGDSTPSYIRPSSHRASNTALQTSTHSTVLYASADGEASSTVLRGSVNIDQGLQASVQASTSSFAAASVLQPEASSNSSIAPPGGAQTPVAASAAPKHGAAAGLPAARPRSMIDASTSSLKSVLQSHANGVGEEGQRAVQAVALDAEGHPAQQQHEDEHFEDATSLPPSTPASVVSGRMSYKGTFFTALKREFSIDNVDPNAGDDGMSTTSGLNPMQSPSASELGLGDEQDDDDEYFDAYGDQDMLAENSAAISNYTNPMMTPADSVANSVDISKASLLGLLRDLYSEPEPAPAPLPQEEPAAPQAEASSAPPPPEPELSTVSQQQTEEPEPTAAAAEEEEEGTADAAEATARQGLQQINEVLAEQDRRRAELGEYMAALQEKKDGDGEPLLELPRNYLAMVEDLIRKKRNEYNALQGWLGPRKFDELPISKLPETDDDPEVAAGLARIRQLDGKLQEKTMEALMVARETFPEKWAEAEKKRLERHQKAVEEALKRERMRRMRGAKLQRAVSSTDTLDTMTGDVPNSVYSRYFKLQPEEEQLVEKVLKRNDDDLEVNPFDISLVLHEPSEPLPSRPTTSDPTGAADADFSFIVQESSQLAMGGDSTGEPAGSLGTSLEEWEQAAGSGGDGSSRPVSAFRPPVIGGRSKFTGLPLAVINARLEEFVSEHLWDERGGLADFSNVRKTPAGGQADGSMPPSPGPQASVTSLGAPNRAPSLRPPSPTHSFAPSSSVMVNGKRDYLREEREAKELASRANEVDARLRALKTGEQPARLAPDELRALIEQCRRLEEIRSQGLNSRPPTDIQPPAAAGTDNAADGAASGNTTANRGGTATSSSPAVAGAPSAGTPKGKTAGSKQLLDGNVPSSPKSNGGAAVPPISGGGTKTRSRSAGDKSAPAPSPLKPAASRQPSAGRTASSSSILASAAGGEAAATTAGGKEQASAPSHAVAHPDKAGHATDRPRSGSRPRSGTSAAGSSTDGTVSNADLERPRSGSTSRPQSGGTGVPSKGAGAPAHGPSPSRLQKGASFGIVTGGTGLSAGTGLERPTSGIARADAAV